MSMDVLEGTVDEEDLTDEGVLDYERFLELRGYVLDQINRMHNKGE